MDMALIWQITLFALGLAVTYGWARAKINEHDDKIKDIEAQLNKLMTTDELKLLIDAQSRRLDALETLARDQNALNMNLAKTLAKLEGWVDSQKDK